jgi:hypothetical protein
VSGYGGAARIQGSHQEQRRVLRIQRISRKGGASKIQGERPGYRGAVAKKEEESGYKACAAYQGIGGRKWARYIIIKLHCTFLPPAQNP